MDSRITATDLVKNLGDVLDRVRNRGERFTVERDGVPVATLAPVPPGPPVVTLGEMIDRLGALAEIQAEQSRPEPPPWPSSSTPASSSPWSDGAGLRAP